MSDIITVRDGDIIAAEINTIKEDTRRIMIANAIRIGGKLTEVKAMVPFGEWGKWLEEKVDYSQSTANNLMKLYQEYGNNQESLFDNWTKSETFANLSYSQHMALLALPFSDRAEFAESHNVAEMSTRELDKAVREELEKAKAELTESKRSLHDALQREMDLEKELRDAEENQDLLREAEARAERLSRDAKAEKEKAEKDRVRAEDSEKNALNLVKKLETQLATAQTAEKVAREELQKAMENPVVSEDVMTKLRKEAETEAAKAAAEKAQKDMDKIRKELEAAKQEAEAAAKARAEAEERAAQLQKQAKMSDPDIIAYQTLAEQLMKNYDVLNDCRLKVAAKNPDAGEKLKRFQTAMVGQWVDTLMGVANG